MMIEADVVLGKIKFQPSSVKVAVMAHPPDRTSDLSLVDKELFFFIYNFS